MFRIDLECGHEGCGETVAEYVLSPAYPQGAIRIMRRCHGKKHETYIDLSCLIKEQLPPIVRDSIRQDRKEQGS